MSNPAKLVLPIVFGILLAVGVYASQTTRDVQANTAAILHLPQVDCTDHGAMITLSWLPAPSTVEQRLEYSVHDNGFAPGTFSSIALEPEQRTHQVRAIRHDLPNFWRIVSVAAAGEVTSRTAMFMPCYRPILLMGEVQCRDFHQASVLYRWAPLAAPLGRQFLEIDTSGTFAGTDLRRIGPLSPNMDTLYRSGFTAGTTYYFRIVREEADGSQLISQVGAFDPGCMPAINPEIYGSNDRLVVPRLGIDAPVNVRDVGWQVELGVPIGAYDVVRYNFAYYPELRGVPGGPGTVVIGGHVDFYEVGLAVFHPLRSAQVGDVIEYYANGTRHTYVVDWVADIPFTEALNPYISTGSTSILLVTCNGTFNPGVGYDQRRLVHAVPQQP